MHTPVPLLCAKPKLVPLDLLNDSLILSKESGCFLHLWFQIKFPLKSIPSKGQNHELF